MWGQTVKKEFTLETDLNVPNLSASSHVVQILM